MTIKKIASFNILCLIFLSQFVPTAYTEVKAIFLLAGCSIIIVGLLKGELFFQRWQIVGVLLFVSTAILYSLYGLVRGNPGALQVLSIWLLWPIIYLLFASLLEQGKSFSYLANMFIFTLISVMLYSYLYIGWSADLVPNFLYFELNQGQDIGFYQGFVEYNLYSISSLIFLVPFYLHYIFEKFKRNSSSVSWKSIILIVLVILLSFLTGRRALIFLLLLTPIVILIVNKFLCNTSRMRYSPRTIILLFIIIFFLPILMTMFDLNFESMLLMVLKGFEFSNTDNIAATERSEQFYSLIDGWLKSSVFFGSGNGAVASIIRSYEMQWAYELTYIYLLFSTGIFGVVFYFGWYAYGLLRLRIAMLKRPDLIVYVGPMLTGSLIFCVASASNPYLGKFDYLWILLLPFFISGWVTYQESESLI